MTAALITAALAVPAFAAGAAIGWLFCLWLNRREWNEAAGYFDEDRDDWRTWIEDHLRRPKPKPRPVLFDGAMYPEDWEAS